ncbi:MAG TPA: flagellar hook-basal body complex protein FliE, partial [Tepidisphaeraceae bacterium]
MIDRLTNLATQQLAKTGAPGGSSATPTEGGASFADVLKQQIGEVAQLQQDASSAVQNLATGKTDDVTGVFVAMEKSETAFKTLLAIRSKLLD